MATFQRFEEIIAWQKARALCKMIKAYTDKELFSKDFKLVGQIRSSSGSAMDILRKDLREGGTKSLYNFFLSRKALLEK